MPIMSHLVSSYGYYIGVVIKSIKTIRNANMFYDTNGYANSLAIKLARNHLSTRHSNLPF